MKLIGKDIAEKAYQDLQKRVDKLKKKNLPADRQGITPHLVVFLIGESPASVAYVNQKQRKGEDIGAKVTVLRYDESVTTKELEEKVKLLNADPYVHGILIQRPVPDHIDIEMLESLTNPEKDIDGFHPNSPYTLPLPLAVVKILEEVFTLNKGVARSEGIPQRAVRSSEDEIRTSTAGRRPGQDPKFKNWLNSKNIVITGKGPTGGGPIIKYFKKLDIVPTVIDSKTPNPDDILKEADIVIAAVGRENMIKAENLKPGVILIGVGILRGADGKLHGDYNEEEVENIASYYTPTPGGVGPVNVAMLFENVLTAAEKQTSSAK